MTAEDEILQQIYSKNVVGFSKGESSSRIKALTKLKAFDLVYEQPKYQWRLTDKGYKAVSVGFDNWLADKQKLKNLMSDDILSIIAMAEKSVNQSRFDNLRDTSIKQTPKPIAYENKQNAISSWVQKFWWQILIPLIIGLIILYIDKNWRQLAY